MVGQLLTYGKTFTAVEYAEANQYIVLQLLQRKKQLERSYSEIYDSQNKVIDAIKTQKHIFLVVNNEYVLTKRVDVINEDERRIVKTAFPNISISDFYYQVISLSGSISFVAIARKETIDGYIKAYLKAGICIVDFSLGNLVIEKLKQFHQYEKLHTTNAEISFENKSISSIEKSTSNETYTINDLEISHNEVLSLAGIISYYTKDAVSTVHQELRERYLQKRFFDVGLKTGLGFLLFVLLVNFFIFSHYRDEVGTLQGELQMSENFKNQINTLKTKVNQKKQVVQSMYSASNGSLSAYFDELGAMLPETSLLTQISHQPKEGIQKKDKPLFFRWNTIVIKGISKNDTDFSNWIADLEQLDWIKEVSILEYGKGKQTGSSSNFEFTIQVND